MNTRRVERRGRPARETPPEARRRPRRSSAVVTVDAMVTAAEQVLDRHGVAGLTTNRVASVAGVSIGSLYQYFPNKNAIVSALFDRYLAQYAAVVPRVIAACRDAAMPELVARIADALADVFLAQPRIHRWMWELRSAAAVHERIDRHLDELVRTAAAVLEARGLAEGEGAHTAAFALVHSIDGAVNAIANRRDAIDVRAVGRQLAHMVEAYLERLARDRQR